jgi:hypothetical protein
MVLDSLRVERMEPYCEKEGATILLSEESVIVAVLLRKARNVLLKKEWGHSVEEENVTIYRGREREWNQTAEEENGIIFLKKKAEQIY